MVTWYVLVYEKKYEECVPAKTEFLEEDAARRYARGFPNMRTAIGRVWTPSDFVGGPMERFADYNKGKSGGWFSQLLGLQ